MSWCRPRPKTRDELFAEAKAVEEEYDRNPHDPQKLKSWVSALVNAVFDNHGNSIRDMPFLHGAKSKLEKILETEKDDLCTKFELGSVCYNILEFDIDNNRCSEAYKTLYDQAVTLFQEVQLKAPGLYDSSGMLEFLERIKPEEFSEPLYEDYAWEEDVDTVGAASVRWYKKACKDAEALFSTDPGNFKNLHGWGASLMGLAYYSVNPFQKLKYTEALFEAKDKFEAASKLEPGNIYNKRDLAEAELNMCCYQKGNGYSELMASYNKLEKEAEEESKKRKRDF